ncbi:hypothetical protein MKW92_027047 [Papaver armeniacum]|nr:hypothetical protein MKW92_027047 [Papaver armeniacum]
MFVEKEDLGLSLSLCSSTSPTTTAENRYPLQLNLMPPSAASVSNNPSPFLIHHQKTNSVTNWNEAFGSSDRITAEMYRGETRSFLRGIDVNRMPSTTATIDCEEEVGVSSPNSTVSSISGNKRRSIERDTINCSGGDGEDNEIERASSRSGGNGGGMNSDDEDGENSRKKLRLSKDQSAILEETFKEHNTLNPKQKLALAKQLNLRPRQVEVWFQNRRARTKLKQTEVDCEFLKRCCENLTEENRRLQKEVQELRALKLSPQFYMQMTPPTTLTMCPSCERVAVSASTNASAAGSTPAVPAPSVAAEAAHHRHHQQQMSAQQRALHTNPWAQAPVVNRR